MRCAASSFLVLALACFLGLVHVEAAPKTFEGPSFRGYRISTCMSDARDACGQPAADAFCASQVQNKCSNAISFVQDTNPPTSPSYQQGDHLVKSPGNGAGIITSVTCECAEARRLRH